MAEVTGPMVLSTLTLTLVDDSVLGGADKIFHSDGEDTKCSEPRNKIAKEHSCFMFCAMYNQGNPADLVRANHHPLMLVVFSHHVLTWSLLQSPPISHLHTIQELIVQISNNHLGLTKNQAHLFCVLHMITLARIDADNFNMLSRIASRVGAHKDLLVSGSLEAHPLAYRSASRCGRESYRVMLGNRLMLHDWRRLS